jgi:hypothetical protein
LILKEFRSITEGGEFGGKGFRKFFSQFIRKSTISTQALLLLLIKTL